MMQSGEGSTMSRSNDNTNNIGLLVGLYKGRDWANIDKFYSKGYEDMADSKSLLNVPFLQKLDFFQKYIYALHQHGRSERANKLWLKLGQPILDKYGSVNSITMQYVLQFIRAREFAIKSDNASMSTHLSHQ